MEVHISHFMEALTGEKTKGPRRTLYVKLQKLQPTIKQNVDEFQNITRFNWKTLPVGLPIYIMAQEALAFGQHALSIGTFSRGDYEKLCKLYVYYLGGDVNGIIFHQPSAC